ncbi:Predicted DNA-binding transcriptional regulator YafY, contains an HTH and WYL domains [Lachnospiraceae bacterium XBB1006]|nr:Predicted DNA-binding transcriptional regulator YafY, contains an HTH and WYL domains [Lachnospiraceae bacterium XBB1006]
MNNIYKFDLLSNIISLINSEEYDASITNLANDCNIPLPYMRKVMLSLIKNQTTQYCLYTSDELFISADNDDDDFDLEQSFIEKYTDDPKRYAELILNGTYDDMTWEFNLRVLDNICDVILPLTHLEYGAITALGESILSIKRGALLEKKETVNPISLEVQKNCDTILTAKSNGYAVSFSYQKSNGEIEQVTCHPVELTTNISDNWIYMSSAEGKSYRLDRFKQIHRIIKTTSPPEYTENPKKKYAWGSYFNDELEPIHVKIRIAAETKNIIRKVKNDLKYRSRTGKLIQDGEYYFFEDDIIGLPEFQRWLRGYGSSIIVLEPQELRDEIVQNAKIILDLYNKSKSWSI